MTVDGAKPIAVALDFALVLPVLYVLLSHQKRIKWITILTLLLGGYLIPKAFINATGVEMLAFTILPLELLFVLLSVSRIIFSLRVYKKQRRTGKPFYDSLKSGIDRVFLQTRGAGYLIHELSMYYYALFAWGINTSSHHNVSTFTYYKSSNIEVFLFFLGFVLAAEGFSEKRDVIAPSIDPPNILIECAVPLEAVLMFGTKKVSKKVYLAVDEAFEFKSLLLESIGATNLICAARDLTCVCLIFICGYCLF